MLVLDTQWGGGYLRPGRGLTRQIFEVGKQGQRWASNEARKHTAVKITAYISTLFWP
jgi:hypothetical protein